jgi:hypothetical protein
MRSVLLAFVTLLLVVGGFAAYLALQPARPAGARSSTFDGKAPAVSPATGPANQGLPISQGERVYVETYDKNKGYLSRRFRADLFDEAHFLECGAQESEERDSSSPTY